MDKAQIIREYLAKNWEAVLSATERDVLAAGLAIYLDKENDDNG